MKILDTAMTEIVKGNSARYYSKYVVDGKEHTETLNNFKFQNIINPNNEITIGNTCASSVTFSIYMPTVSLENKEITIFEGVKVGAEINYIKLGIFTVTKQTSDGEYTSYEAYDRMYKADMPYFSDMAFPSTDKAILNEICGKLGISLARNIVTAHTISDKPQGYTYREIIGYMAMLQGCNAVINSDGNLELRWYKDSGYVLDGHKYYQQGVTFTTSKDFIIQKLTCNNTKSGSTEQSQITSGDGATGLSFANPFMTQAILDEVYKKIGGFTFRPLTVKFVGDYRLEVGDIITVNKGGADYKVPIMQITHECDGGLMDTVTSIGQSDTENTSVASGPITKQMERYYADLILVNKALINKLSVDEADIRYASIETLKAVNANIDNLKTNKLDATYADIINANVESLKAANAEITQLKADSLTADIADLKYAQIDFANVKGQVVTTSLIKDGAVTNEKVQSLSANKLTAGTIDASKITVTNLNADNITVGTINGKRIGTGSLSLDKLAEEVPTKEYLDKVQEDLQGQIDGNIETFTKTEIPTLNNEPAVSWTDNATRKKHIGDICYVVNPASSADGYSYRFADTGTLEAPNYEWVLIKDSDVTKALQDIININGEITGIKKFNVEISSWKTNTDSELSSLKARTTNLETDMGNKVDTKTFNEVKQTVDENSSTITKMSETLSNKADSSTVTALSNTVNSIKQTSDNNSLSISNLTKVVEKKANQDEVTSISNKITTVEQNLNGLKVDVTNQYQYIDNQLNGNHKIYEIAHAPTKDNYPANEWSIQIYPSDDRYPSDSTWEYTEDEYEKYVGTIAYWKDQQRAWRFIRKSDGTHDWVEISATETTYLLNQNASLRIDVNNISTSLSSLTTNVQSNYSTTTQMNNAITQAITAESNSNKSEIYTTYVTKNALTDYSTTEAMNNAITQAITKESNSIKLEVSGTYATKNDINNLQIGGVNRFIKSTVTPNKYITATGIITDGGNYWDLTDYIDVSKWKNYVASGWTNLGNAPATCFYDSNKKFISGVADKSTGVRGSLPVPSNAVYMRFSFAHVDTNKLKIEKGTKATDYSPAPEDIDVKFNNYATTASLEAYIKKDPTTGELKSAIEAIADDITLNASGTINISGNKSVNINGNLFTLTSTNTTISADGSIDCKKLKAVNADLEGTFKNVNVTEEGITMTTTIIGGEYLMKSSTGAFLQMQGHYIEMSNDDGSGTKWILSRSECVFNDYLNVKLYHPSLKNYMRPALSMSNPVTFDWSGSVLTIYVDDVAVATWDWAQKNWY